MRNFCCFAVALAALAPALCAQSSATLSPMTPNIPAQFTPPRTGYDYTKREIMIPMRDGVKLYTVIAIPNGAKNAPIVLNRTPYNAAKRMQAAESAQMLNALPRGDDGRTSAVNPPAESAAWPRQLRSTACSIPPAAAVVPQEPCPQPAASQPIVPARYTATASSVMERQQ